MRGTAVPAMSFHATLPHWFLVLVIVLVAWFVLKKLIKIALVIGAIGLLVYLLWWQGWLARAFAVLPGATLPPT